MDYDTSETRAAKRQRRRSRSKSSEPVSQPARPPQYALPISESMSQMSIASASILASNEQPTQFLPALRGPSEHNQPKKTLKQQVAILEKLLENESSGVTQDLFNRIPPKTFDNWISSKTDSLPPLSTWNSSVRSRPIEGNTQYRTVGEAIDNYEPKEQLTRSKKQRREELQKLNRLIKDKKLKREQFRQKVEDRGNTHDEIAKSTYTGWLAPSIIDRVLPSSDTWNKYRSRPMPDNSYPTIGDAIDNYEPKEQLTRYKKQISEELQKLNRLIKDKKLKREQFRQKVEDRGNTHDEIAKSTYNLWLNPNTNDRHLPSSDTWNKYRSRPMPNNSYPTIGEAIDNYEPNQSQSQQSAPQSQPQPERLSVVGNEPTDTGRQFDDEELYGP